MEVHRRLGPGLLERIYHECLFHELLKLELEVASEVSMDVTYDDLVLENAYRIDLLVENQVVVELKSVEEVSSLHRAQVLSYLKLGGFQLGLLINFNVPFLKNGVERIVNGLVE